MRRGVALAVAAIAGCGSGGQPKQLAMTPLPDSPPTRVDDVVTLDAVFGSLAIDRGFLYYTVFAPEGAVYRVPLAGGKPALLAHTSGPRGIAVVGDDLYVASNGLVRIGITGGAPVQVLSGRACFDVASDGRAAYATCPGTFGTDGPFAPTSPTPDGTIVRADRSGVTTIADRLAHPNAIAAGEPAHVTIRAVTAGSQPVRLAGLSNPSGVARLGDWLYVADLGAGLVRVPISGGPPEPVLTDLAAPGWVASDGHSVFVTDQVVGARGGVWRVGLGPPVKLAAIPSATRIALADRALFVISAATNAQRIVALRW
jgi:hypothetical protein